MSRVSFGAASLALAWAALAPQARGQTLSLREPDRYVVPASSVPEPIASGDLDGDGVLDLAIANTGAPPSAGGDTVTILLGGGYGTFVLAGEHPVGRRPEGIAVLDADGDGALDIATANMEGDSVSFLRGRGDGTFAPEASTAVPGGPRSVVAADLDGDGDPDLVTSNYDGDSVSVLLGDGAGTFSLALTRGVGNGPEVVIVAEIDGDEGPELVTCNRLADTLTLLDVGADASVTVAAQHAVGQGPRFLVAVDLDVDGLDELVTADSEADTLTVVRNLGDLNLENVATVTGSFGGTTFGGPVGLDVADATGDGSPDLLVAWASSDVLTVHEGTGAPFAFAAPRYLPVGDNPVGILCRDLDGDGDADVVVTNALSDEVWVYRSAVQDRGTLVDNLDPGTTAIGDWSLSGAPFPWGADSIFARSDASFLWEASLPASGEYDVFLWWTVSGGRSSSVPVEVRHASGAASVSVDQTRGLGTWHWVGRFEFLALATVLVSANGSGSACADAVRFAPAVGLPASAVRVARASVPEDLEVAPGKKLAFQGTFEVQAGPESVSWLDLSVRPTGPGAEAEEISEVKLWVDSNGSGALDPGDEQLGGTRAFASESDTIVFDGFRVALPAAASTEFFVVCTLAPETVVSPRTGGSGAVLGSVGALGALALLRKRRSRRGTASRIALLTLALVGAHLAGCGGGGGGATPPDALRIEVSAARLEGADSGISTLAVGLPAEGWSF